MFVLLAGLSSLVILPLLLWFVPETLQYKVLQRFSSQQPTAAGKIAEAATILGQVCWLPPGTSGLQCMILRQLPYLLACACMASIFPPAYSSGAVLNGGLVHSTCLGILCGPAKPQAPH